MSSTTAKSEQEIYQIVPPPHPPISSFPRDASELIMMSRSDTPSAQVLTNLRNAKTVWGEASAQYKAAVETAGLCLPDRKLKDKSKDEEEDTAQLVASLEALVLDR